MDNFDAHKWFKKQYLEEGMSDEEIQAIKRFEELSNDDKLKLAKIQAMMDRERSLREDDDDMTPEEIEDFKLRQAVHRLKHTGRTLDDERKAAGLNEISRDTYDRMESLANQRELNELKDLIMILGGEWANEGFENEDIVDYFEVLVGQLVKM